jgi:hypothetical protein
MIRAPSSSGPGTSTSPWKWALWGDRANYGGSPGDEAIETHYLYVGPHDHRDGPFWNASFGATLPYDDVRQGSDPLAFFRAGQETLRRS